MSPGPIPGRNSLHQSLDDDTAQGLSQAWNDLSLALIDELHAIAAESIRGVADAAKHGLERSQESTPPESVNGINGEATGRGWSPWLVGAAVGIGVTLITRWR